MAGAAGVQWACDERLASMQRVLVIIGLVRVNRNAHRELLLAFGICVAVAVGLAGWALWPRPASPPQARQYLDVTACLLTGPRGVTPGSPAAPVWTSMQQVSLATRVMVSYLPDTGHNDIPLLLNTLVQRRCGVIITAEAPAAPVTQAAKANPRQHFLLITSQSAATAAAPNLVVAAAADASGPISRELHSLAASS
jgi:hypothetical protein